MAELKNTMEIFKLLDKSNCRECNEKTCLVFAAAVFKGSRQIEECPHLDREIIDKYLGKTKRAQSIEEDMADAVAHLKSRVVNIDFAAAADRIGGGFCSR